MRLQGIAVSLPICDWRYLSHTHARQPWLLDLVSLQGKAFIRGFGKLGKTHRLSMPWRSTEAYFFNCNRLVVWQRNRLPNDVPISHVLRRVYFDQRALVRFELAAFYDGTRTDGETKQPSIDAIARDFMLQPFFRLRSVRGPVTESLLSVLSKLPDAFCESTATAGSINKSERCEALKPDLQLIFETSPEDVPTRAKQIDRGRYSLSFGDVMIEGYEAHTTCIFFNKGLLTSRSDPHFNRMRLLRRQLRWLHADLEMLHRLLQRRIKKRVSHARLDQYIMDLSRILGEHPTGNGMDPFVGEVTAAFMSERAMRISFLKEALSRLGLTAR